VGETESFPNGEALQRRSNVQHQVTFCDSRPNVRYSKLKEICPEFNVRKTEFAGENRETYWKNIFNFKRLKVSKQKVFTGMIENNGVAMCVHYRRSKVDRPIVPFASPSAKHEESKEADPVMQEVQDNDSVVGADPGNTNIVTIAVPKHGVYGNDGNLRQKDMRLLRISRARCYRESGIMNVRKKISAWDAGMKDHLEATSAVTSREADFKAFRKFVEVRVAHWDALWEEYTKPRWARLRMNLYCGKQRAFANFFNELSALKEDENQRLVVAYGAGRWTTQKGCTPAPTTRVYKECARRFVTNPVDEFRTSYTHHELGCTLQRV